MEQDNKFIKSLVESAQNGNNSAFEQLFRLNCGRVFTLCTRLAADPIAAQYLTVNIFIKAFQDIAFARKDTSFSSWLAGITVYITLQELRDEKSELNKGKLSDKKEREIATGIFFEASNDSLLDSSISKLDFNSRMAVVLKDIEEYSLDETLDIMGIPIETFYGIIIVAHDALMKNLDIAGDEEILVQMLNRLNQKIQPGVDLWPQIFNGLNTSEETKPGEKENEAVKNFGDFKSHKLKKVKEKKSGTKIRKDKNISIPGKKSVIFIQIFKSAFYIILAGALVYAGYHFLYANKNSWEVIKIKGQPLLGVNNVENKEPFTDGKVLTSDSLSEAEIKINGYGKIKVFPATKIKKLAEADAISIQAGKISAHRGEGERKMVLMLPYGEIIDTIAGSSYDVELNSVGEATVSVIKGFVWVKEKNQEYVVSAKYICNGVRDRSMGIPYYLTADKTMRVSLSYFDINNEKATLFGGILKNSTEKDAVSLWNLFSMVSRDDRFKLYDKLASFVPPPDDVDKSGIIQLNRNMLLSWLKKIILVIS